MKNLFLLLLIIISSQSIAQKNKLSLSIGPSLADPLNTSGTEYFKTGAGAGLRAFYPVSKRGSVMSNIDFVAFPNTSKFQTSFSLLSFKAGYKTFIGNSNFYLYGDAGIVRLYTTSPARSPYRIVTSAFGFGLGGGYSYPLTKNSFLDISPNLNYNTSYFGRRLTPEINISYRFNLHKK